MAHILFLSYFFSPDGLSTAVLMAELARGLQAKGHRITVITTTPHCNREPEAVARQPLHRRWGLQLQESELDGIRVFHVQVAPKGNRVWLRALDYVRYHALGTMAGCTLAGHPDAVFAPSPPLTVGIQAWLLSLVHRIPFIYNVQEIYPDVAVQLGVLRSRPIIWLMEGMERFIYLRAARVAVISERFREALLAKRVPQGQMAVIPNFVDTAFVQPSERKNTFSREHGLDETFTILYAGNIGLTQDWEAVLGAAQSLAGRANLRFVFVGGGARRDWLEAQAQKRGLGNVVLLPYQPRSSVPGIYASSDLCLVPMKRGMARDTFPSKVYTIMAAGRATLAAADVDSELSRLVHSAECGWVVPPGDAVALAVAVQEACAQREELQEMGERGRRYVLAHHSVAAIVEQYHQLISEILA